MKRLKQEFEDYPCDEYFDEYYSQGLFHPTECQDLFTHDSVQFDDTKGVLRIGEIWDDHDMNICYRKSVDGVWAEYNYNGEIVFLANTLKEMTEGWYQRNSQYWYSLNQYELWKEIINHLRLNRERYQWEITEILRFAEACLLSPASAKFHVWASGNSLTISLKNSTSLRPQKNIVMASYDEQKSRFKLHFMANYNDYISTSYYHTDQIDFMISDFNKWILQDQ